MMYHNYSFFSIYGTISQNFPIVFSKRGKFLFGRQHITEKKRSSSLTSEVKSLIAGDEILGWCDYDV